jgi:hypothetical protein
MIRANHSRAIEAINEAALEILQGNEATAHALLMKGLAALGSTRRPRVWIFRDNERNLLAFHAESMRPFDLECIEDEPVVCPVCDQLLDHERDLPAPREDTTSHEARCAGCTTRYAIVRGTDERLSILGLTPIHENSRPEGRALEM